jgi:hypothetical protein
MSMYTQLLEAALGARAISGQTRPVDASLAEVFRCRRQLEEVGPSDSVVDRVSAALADQVGYDVALIELTRALGIECDPRGFDQPQQQRHKLEHGLEVRGIRLTEGEASIDAAT